MTLIYKLVRVVGLSVMVVGAVSLRPAIVAAQDATTDAISPTTEVGQAPQDFGVVRTAGLNTLEIRHLSGGYRTYAASSDLTSSMALGPGDLVTFKADANGTITQLQPPRISQIFEGTISNIQGDQVTIIAADGSSLTTTLAPNSVRRLALVPGNGLSVTQYEGTNATKVCSNVSKPASKPAQQSPVTRPSKPPIPPAVPIQPIPALW